MDITPAASNSGQPRNPLVGICGHPRPMRPIVWHLRPCGPTLCSHYNSSLCGSMEFHGNRFIIITSGDPGEFTSPTKFDPRSSISIKFHSTSLESAAVRRSLAEHSTRSRWITSSITIIHSGELISPIDPPHQNQIQECLSS